MVSYDPADPDMDWEPVANENFWADDPGYITQYTWDTGGPAKVTKFEFIDGPAPDFMSLGLMDFDYRGIGA